MPRLRTRKRVAGKSVGPSRAQRSGCAPSIADTAKWRARERRPMLQELSAATDGLAWTPGLVRLLLEELYVDDEIHRWVSVDPRSNVGTVPQVVAIAIALRHSWRKDDFVETVRRLRLSAHDSNRSLCGD